MNRNWTPLRRAAGAAILTALAAAGPAAAQAPPTITLEGARLARLRQAAEALRRRQPARRAAGPGDRDPAGRGGAADRGRHDPRRRHVRPDGEDDAARPARGPDGRRRLAARRADGRAADHRALGRHAPAGRADRAQGPARARRRGHRQRADRPRRPLPAAHARHPRGPPLHPRAREAQPRLRQARRPQALHHHRRTGARGGLARVPPCASSSAAWTACTTCCSTATPPSAPTPATPSTRSRRSRASRAPASSARRCGTRSPARAHPARLARRHPHRGPQAPPGALRGPRRPRQARREHLDRPDRQHAGRPLADLPQGRRLQLARDARRALLHRRLRRPRLPLGAALPGQPRLRARPAVGGARRSSGAGASATPSTCSDAERADRRGGLRRARRGDRAAPPRLRRRPHPREGGQLRRHVAAQHLSRRRLRRPQPPLLVLVLPAARLGAAVPDAARHSALPARGRRRGGPRADHRDRHARDRVPLGRASAPLDGRDEPRRADRGRADRRHGPAPPARDAVRWRASSPATASTRPSGTTATTCAASASRSSARARARCSSSRPWSSRPRTRRSSSARATGSCRAATAPTRRLPLDDPPRAGLPERCGGAAGSGSARAYDGDPPPAHGRSRLRRVFVAVHAPPARATPSCASGSGRTTRSAASGCCSPRRSCRRSPATTSRS